MYEWVFLMTVSSTTTTTSKRIIMVMIIMMKQMKTFNNRNMVCDLKVDMGGGL